MSCDWFKVRLCRLTCNAGTSLQFRPAATVYSFSEKRFLLGQYRYYHNWPWLWIDFWILGFGNGVASMSCHLETHGLLVFLILRDPMKFDFFFIMLVIERIKFGVFHLSRHGFQTAKVQVQSCRFKESSVMKGKKACSFWFWFARVQTRAFVFLYHGGACHQRWWVVLDSCLQFIHVSECNEIM